MGMDLKPINPTADAPKETMRRGGYQWGRYNWTGWQWLADHLEEWGVNTSEFASVNDGDPISEETCKQIADAIEKHLPELSERHQNWLQPHIQLWRTCGGYEQH